MKLSRKIEWFIDSDLPVSKLTLCEWLIRAESYEERIEELVAYQKMAMRAAQDLLDKTDEIRKQIEERPKPKGKWWQP